MSIKLFDLAGADPDLRFSPYCWRTKMALKHKGLGFETIPWRFTDKDKLAPAGSVRVPTLIDGTKWVHDSWTIALYLDEAYPTRPKLFPDLAARIHARFLNSWSDWSLLPNAREMTVPQVFANIDPKDKAYFRESREKALGTPLEKVGEDRAAARKKFVQGLKPAEVMLGDHVFLHGAAPGYGDYAVFGALMWPYTLTPEPLFPEESAVAAWFGRMLALFDGYAAKAPTVRTLRAKA